MTSLPENAEQVRILNSEYNTHYYFLQRTDRLKAFHKFLMENRVSELPKNTMPGISGAAHYGLDCIFFGPKPSRFPAIDILTYLRDTLLASGEVPDPPVTTPEIEHVLGQWAGTVSQLLADGSDRA